MKETTKKHSSKRFESEAYYVLSFLELESRWDAYPTLDRVVEHSPKLEILRRLFVEGMIMTENPEDGNGLSEFLEGKRSLDGIDEIQLKVTERGSENLKRLMSLHINQKQ